MYFTPNKTKHGVLMFIILLNIAKTKLEEELYTFRSFLFVFPIYIASFCQVTRTLTFEI